LNLTSQLNELLVREVGWSLQGGTVKVLLNSPDRRESLQGVGRGAKRRRSRERGRSIKRANAIHPERILKGKSLINQNIDSKYLYIVYILCSYMYIKSFDGTKIWYGASIKNNLTLVFIHGWANNWTTWKKEISFFKKKGYSIIYIDLRGHGKSEKPEEKEKYGLECFAKDIHQIIKEEKLNDFILVGHSMGGMIALKYYELFHTENKIKGIILCNTTYRNILEHKKINFISPFILHVLDFIIAHESINIKHFKHLKNVDLTKYKNMSDYLIFYEGLHNTPMKSVFSCLEAMMKFNVSNILGKINNPVLIIQGNKDKLISTISSNELYHKIKNAELEFIPKGKHFINIEYPELVEKHILSFLEKHDLGIRPRN
jgi:pimeloyl-ACP methyl ester carboxylesterase